MKYISVKEAAKLWGLSERSVRNYCAQGRVEGAFLTGKTWNVPENAKKPARANSAETVPTTLAEILEDNGIKIEPSVRSDAFTVTVLTTTQQYEKTLELLNEVLNNATFSEYELDKVKNDKIKFD